jgi:hypothetical protein
MEELHASFLLKCILKSLTLLVKEIIVPIKLPIFGGVAFLT